MNTTGKLIRLNPAHLDFTKILQMDLEQFPRPWSTGDWTDLNWKHHLLFGWRVGNETVGFVLFSAISDDDSSHLLKICVDPGVRGQGMSLAFWDACLEELHFNGIKSIYLEVESHNLRAIGFYKKLSFETLRTIKGFYSDGADAVTMQVTI
jgi:[ribosomal protein S18]-alanine N-acetyltransferase